MTPKRLIILIVCMTALISSPCLAEPPDTIYHGGPILTIDDENPRAEAVAVVDGKIVAVGTKSEVLQLADQKTRMVDLQGKTLLPGFVDAHGHAYGVGLQASTANLLPPPDGKGKDIASLQALLTDWAQNNQEAVKEVGWIAGFGYDDSQLTEQRHPTRQELDAVSKDVPILIIHQSGHLGVANSKALEMAGITKDTKNPKGGVFRREEGSNQPNGVCEEYAFFYLLGKLIGQFDEGINETLVVQGTRLYSSFGYTTVQEGRAINANLKAMKQAAKDGRLEVDLVAYPDVLEVDDVSPSKTYKNNFRVGGVKLTIDGSPQGKTAWLSQPYYVVPEGQPKDYRGQPVIDQKTADSAVEKAFANGWQILCHVNGDAAIGSYIEAVGKARKKYPQTNNRPVLIHGQTIRESQVDQLKELELFPSLFPMHTFYWGDWHRNSVLGPEWADNISPTGWVLERGMKFSSHHDAPVALPDSMRVLSATVTRRTRSGDILGPIHCVPVETALKALTLWPAWQHFEENTKGSIEVGKLADFVILSDDPTAVPREDLASLHVLETIKEDRVIYKRGEKEAYATPALFGVTPNNANHNAHGPEPVCGDGCFNPGFSALYRAFLAK
jgi:predicted amidohydrolase YtcJ